MRITVDYDAQGRLILDNQGTKYEVTLESKDAHGTTTPLALQPGDTANKIKALIAGLVEAHILHDQVSSDLSQINAQGLLYTNGTLKDHNFTIYDDAQGESRRLATERIVRDVGPHLGTTYVTEMVKADTVWKRLEHLASHPPAPSSTTAAFTFAPQPHPSLDPLRPINPRSVSPPPSPASPLSPLSPQASTPPSNFFDDAEEITADLTLNPPPPLPSKAGKQVHFNPSTIVSPPPSPASPLSPLSPQASTPPSNFFDDAEEITAELTLNSPHPLPSKRRKQVHFDPSTTLSPPLSPASPLSPLSPQAPPLPSNLFDDADEITADLTLNSPHPLPSKRRKQVHFDPSTTERDNRKLPLPRKGARKKPQIYTIGPAATRMNQKFHRKYTGQLNGSV